jgi:hypothetical protein
MEHFNTYSVNSRKAKQKWIPVIEEAIRNHYPEVIANPLLLCDTDKYPLRMIVPGKSLQYLAVIKLMIRVARSEEIKLSAAGDLHVDTHFFDIADVISCFRQYMEKNGWKNFTVKSTTTYLYSLSGTKEEKGIVESFAAEGIGTAWTTDVRFVKRNNRREPEQYVRIDAEDVKERLRRVIFNLVNAKVENSDTELLIAFANDIATSEIILRYIPALKSFGFRIFGVKSAEEVTKF